MKALLKSYGAIESGNRDDSNTVLAGTYVGIACCFIQVYTST